MRFVLPRARCKSTIMWLSLVCSETAWRKRANYTRQETKPSPVTLHSDPFRRLPRSERRMGGPQGGGTPAPPARSSSPLRPIRSRSTGATARSDASPNGAGGAGALECLISFFAEKEQNCRLLSASRCEEYDYWAGPGDLRICSASGFAISSRPLAPQRRLRP
jgi:hypothetical protein